MAPTAIEVEELGIGIPKKAAINPETTLLAALTVDLGDTVRMAMSINNNTGASATKDLLAGYGTLDPTTNVFTMAFGCVSPTVSLPTGTSTKNVDCGASAQGVDFDALAAIGVYDGVTGSFSIENSLVKTSQLTVKGIALTGFALSEV